MPSPLIASLALFALLVCARADVNFHLRTIESTPKNYGIPRSLLSGCLFEGRWHPSGAEVTTSESCLRCVCSRNVLSCRRRSCTPLPDPPPRSCYVKHRPESCCPELHCKDAVIDMEQDVPRIEDGPEIHLSHTNGLTCVEGGTLYSSGSAMSSNVACEQCFCLQGARKCVRPKCLPPPPHCVSRPTSGACCPQRYYCEYNTEAVQGNSHDCEVDGKRVQEGDRVVSNANCTACFCLKGQVRCQALSCAPPLHGCAPILKPGDCCAHQYKCEHNIQNETGFPRLPFYHRLNYNALLSSSRNDDRALKKWSETSTKKVIYRAADNTTITSTTKVKRKADEAPSVATKNTHNVTESLNISTTQKAVTAAKSKVETTETAAEVTTEQPEGTVKIVINGTINCTAELSSTSLPLSITHNDSEKIQAEIMPRIPIINGIEAQTYSPNDIITDRSVNGDFDENDTFTINVTSSLNANINSTSRPAIATASKKPVPVDLMNTLNSSKKTKGDYDYDYTEPTLPPSLPNLKIIPFVAADAVVDDESSKGPQTYPILEREDKFPVYYPAETKDTSFTRREENYHPTQYPVFISEKDSDYTHDVDLTSHRYPVMNDPLNVREYTVSTSLGSHMNDGKVVTKAPATSSTFELETPAVNLFSPPVETEGGFIPKGPGIIDEYYAVYPSTPSGPAVPHLTTSMQLDTTKGDCVSEDGQTIPEGTKFSIECSECVCAWSHLSCTPILCKAPLGCHFTKPKADSINHCCGDIVCKTDNKTTSTTARPVTEKPQAVKTNQGNPEKNETRIDSVQPSQLHNTPIQTNFQPLNTTAKQPTEDKPLEKPKPTSPTKTTMITDVPNTTQKPFTGSASNITKTTPSTLSTKPATKLTTTAAPIDTKEVNDTSSEYEDDDDDGFSFGSVLKLLLSDNYDSTTSSPYKKPTTTKPPTRPPVPTIITTRRPPSTVNPFIPLPAMPFVPPKIAPSTVNRIDHLVLGEATAIKRTTPKPITNKTTKRPTEKPTERPNLDKTFTPGIRPPSLDALPNSDPSGVGAGLLKLAGCNIYGRIYRVGRIIAELSTPCQECWCIEIGVQCNKLEC